MAEPAQQSSESSKQPRSTSFALVLVIAAQSITFLSLSFAQGFLPFYLTQDLGVSSGESLALWIGATSAVGRSWWFVEPALGCALGPVWPEADDGPRACGEWRSSGFERSGSGSLAISAHPHAVWDCYRCQRADDRSDQRARAA